MKESFDIFKRLGRFSSWQKAKVAVALRLYLRYKRKIRNKVMSKRKAPSDGTSENRSTKDTSASTELNVTALEKAEVEVIKNFAKGCIPIRNKESPRQPSEREVRKSCAGQRKEDRVKEDMFSSH